MRRVLTTGLAAAVLVLGGCSGDGGTPPPGESDVDVNTPQLQKLKADAGIEPCEPGPGGGALPELTLPCLGGGVDVDLSTLRGPLVINLWQSFCVPCRTEMPALQAFYEEHGDEVPVLGIDWVDPQPEGALELARTTGVTYPLLADPDATLLEQRDLELVGSSPQLLFLDADGTISGTIHFGGVDSAGEVVDLVRKNLGIGL